MGIVGSVHIPRHTSLSILPKQLTEKNARANAAGHGENDEKIKWEGGSQ